MYIWLNACVWLTDGDNECMCGVFEEDNGFYVGLSLQKTGEQGEQGWLNELVVIAGRLCVGCCCSLQTD